MPVYPKKVFITGAGGLIGSATCAELTARGIEIRALLKDDESDENLARFENIDIRRGDIRDLSSMRELLGGCDACIHSAALNKLWHRPEKDFEEINVEGTKNLCSAAKELGVSRFVYTSSCEVMGPAEPGPPADETRHILMERVHGGYERSKYEAEILVRALARKGLSVNIIRPTAVVGPGDIHGTPPGRLITRYLTGGIKAYYDAGINIVDARDIAKAHASALFSDKDGETYIVGGQNLRLSELFELIGHEAKIDLHPKNVSYTTAYLAAIVFNLKSMINSKDPGLTLNGVRTIKHPWYFD